MNKKTTVSYQSIVLIELVKKGEKLMKLALNCERNLARSALKMMGSQTCYAFTDVVILLCLWKVRLFTMHREHHSDHEKPPPIVLRSSCQKVDA